ncbi:MAG: hypothetical protein ACI3YE_03345 [Candidatus Avispirillum sp.]
MPIKYSPNYNFVLVDSSDTDVTQISYVIGTSGSQETSNFMILDATLKKIEDVMGASTRIYIDAVSTDGTTYTATTADIPEYVKDMVVIASLSKSNTGAASLNINSFGAKYIKKYNTSGNLVDLTNEVLKTGINYLLRYDGEYFILLTPILIEDLKTEVSDDRILIAKNGIISDSGIPIDSIESKANKASSYTSGNLAALDSNGDLADSGKKASDFANASHTHPKSQISDFPETMTPTAHADTHKTGGTDAIAPGDIGAESSIKNTVEKTGIVDNDLVVIIDSEDSNKTKKFSWSKVKNALKGFIDTVYTTALISLTGYSKASSFSAISETDSINAAIGKLEAGVNANKISVTGILKGTGSGVAAAVAGTDYSTSDTVGEQLQSYLPLTGGTLTGGLNLKGYSEGVEALSGTQISPATANNFTKAINTDTTFTIVTEGMATDKCYAITLVLTMGATAYTITWPSITWADSAPAPEANTVTEVVLRTYDGGATWYGSVGGVFSVSA